MFCRKFHISQSLDFCRLSCLSLFVLFFFCFVIVRVWLFLFCYCTGLLSILYLRFLLILWYLQTFLNKWHKWKWMMYEECVASCTYNTICSAPDEKQFVMSGCWYSFVIQIVSIIFDVWLFFLWFSKFPPQNPIPISHFGPSWSVVAL